MTKSREGDCILNCNTDRLKVAEPHGIRRELFLLRPDPWLHLGSWWRQLTYSWESVSLHKLMSLYIKCLYKSHSKLYSIAIMYLCLCKTQIHKVRKQWSKIFNLKKWFIEKFLLDNQKTKIFYHEQY